LNRSSCTKFNNIWSCGMHFTFIGIWWYTYKLP